METKKIKIINCSLNLGELHLVKDFGHINPVFDCEDEKGKLFRASMRLHISEQLDGLVFADPRKYADEGIYVNSVGSKVIVRKENFRDALPKNIIDDEKSLCDVTLYKVDSESLIIALLGGYNFEEERKKYLTDKNKKLEIAFTCHNPNIIGGGNVILFRLINWLDALGIKVTVYSCGVPPTWKRVNATFKCYQSYKEMFKSIDERVVVIYSMWHIEPMMKANPKGKLIYHLRQIYEPYHYGSDYKTMISHKYAIELLETLPIGVITISPHLKEYYRKFHNMDSHLITNGVDPSVFFPTRKLRANPKEYSIISVGNPDHFVKGTSDLAEALKKVALRRKDLILKWNVLTGSPSRINLKHVPENLIIKLITSQNQLQMRKHYSNADIFVNPSLYEGFGLPTIEAMFCGTPVVQVDNLGLDYIIEDNKDCLLVPMKNENKIAEAIEKLIDDKNLYNKLREGGYNKASQYTTRHQFEMFLQESQIILDYKFDKEKIDALNKSLGYNHKNFPSLNAVLTEENKFNPLVSVVIPSYNQAQYLREALDSLIAQTYTNWEAVVVNDGSEDYTEDVMSEYSAKDPRIRPFSKPNGGITSALNAGLEKARGEFFCWLSSDDLFYPTKLDLQVKVYENLDKSYALVYGSFDILNESQTTKEIQKRPFAQPIINGCEFPEALKFDFIDGCTIMIRMSVMRELKGFNPGIVHSQDMELWIRIASRGYRFHLLPNKLTIRRVHIAQSSTSNMIYCRYDAAWMINYYLEHYSLLEMYRYINFNSDEGIKLFVEHFVSRTFDTEANINHPLLQEKYWNWFREGIRALPTQNQNVILINCSNYFIKNQKITYKIQYYIEQCTIEIQKTRLFVPRVTEHSHVGRDFRESDRAKDQFATKLFEYGLNLLVNKNTPLFAQELYFHNTNKLVDTPYKLAHSAFMYLSQFPNSYRDIVKPLIGLEDIPKNQAEAIEYLVRLAFPSIAQKLDLKKPSLGSSDFVNEIEKYIPQLLTNEKELLRRLCANNSTEPMLYFWNGLLLSSGDKIFEAIEEAWKIFGYDISTLQPQVFAKMFDWAKKINDVEKAYYLAIINSKVNPASEIIKQKETLLNKFSSANSILPKLNSVYKEKSKREPSEVIINKCEVIPRLDGNYYLYLECITPDNKTINANGLFQYQTVFEPKKINDYETGKEYLISPRHIFDYWCNKYDFFDSLEIDLLSRLSKNVVASVAFISPYTDSVNGGTLVALRMANWLHELGIQVTVYSHRKKPAWFDLKCNFVSFSEINALYASIKEHVVIAHSVLEIPEILRYCKGNKRIYHLAQVVEDFHYHGHDLKSAMMPKGVFELLHSLPIGRISVSKHIDNYLNKHYKQKSYLIENGIDNLNFRPGYKKPTSNEITISTVGNTNRLLKGADDVIDAIEMIALKHPEYKFNLIIVSNDRPGIDSKLNYKSFRFNLTMLYGLSQNEMHDIYLRSDFYVNASWYEGFGLPTIEAMACGIPVLQADNKGLDEIIIDQKNCIVFQPANPEDLYHKIESILGREEKINMLVSEGLKTSSIYSLAKHFDDFIDVFEKILIYKFSRTNVAKLKKITSDGDYNYRLISIKNIVNPKISVIIPVDSNNLDLEDTLTSLIMQEYPNWEACIVYNEIDVVNYSFIKSISKLNRNIKYVKCGSSNYAELLNEGFRNVNGSWLTILIPGVIYSQTRFKSLVNQIQLNFDKKLFYTDYYLNNKLNNQTPNYLDSISTIPLDQYQLFGLLNNNNIRDYSLLINTKLVAKLGGFESKYNTASVHNLLLKVHKNYKSMFVLDNSCTITDKMIKSRINQVDMDVSLTDFLRNSLFKELFPFFEFDDEHEIKKLTANVLAEISKEESLLHKNSLNILFSQCILRWCELSKDKKRVETINDYIKNKDHFNYNSKDVYYKFNIDFVKSNASFLSYQEKKITSTKVVSSSVINTEPTVSIIIVTYNQIEYTLKCLKSIIEFAKTSYEIIVVDNASEDDTQIQLRSWDNIKLLENKNNLGFPTSVNQGIVVSRGKYILLLNNDTIVTKNWLEKMINAVGSKTEIGIVGPISNSVSGVQIDKSAKYKTIKDMHKHARKIAYDNKNKVVEFPRVAFLCTLIKKEVIEKIGGLDERFSPGNYEDDDFCLRAQLAGYKTVVAKDVFIHHYGSKSFKADGDEKYNKLLQTNKQKFIDKWGATPDDIWLHGKNVKNNVDLLFPIRKLSVENNFQKALKMINDKNFVSAEKYLADCIILVSENNDSKIDIIKIKELYEKVKLLINTEVEI